LRILSSDLIISHDYHFSGLKSRDSLFVVWLPVGDSPERIGKREKKMFLSLFSMLPVLAAGRDGGEEGVFERDIQRPLFLNFSRARGRKLLGYLSNPSIEIFRCLRNILLL